MLKLDKVSKFYSAGGVVTSGFSKISLNFDVGEFVAITGESGSGKSTLLNVISGLDSYEEGEMYIFDQPTSGYGKEEMEAYRKKYIGNIFQTFNLINNYTVYQNIELVLLLSGYKKSEIKGRVDELIERVGLKDYRNTKASKLSGGQKQRVAIARALAKETPIIVADEPTGNLDKKSAEGIIELLASLSKDKLVIIVTHNYEQVEMYATRKITMRDGKLSEDKRFASPMLLEAQEKMAGLSEINVSPSKKQKDTGNGNDRVELAKHDGLRFGNTLRLGVRNTFSLPAKLVLLLFVFIFMCTGTAASYGTMQNMRLSVNDAVFNSVFPDASSKRLVVTKQDKSAFTEEDYAAISKVSNVKEIEKYGLLTDFLVGFSNVPFDAISDDGNADNQTYLQLKAKSIKGYEKRLVSGRLPEKPNEVILMVGKEDDYILSSLGNNSEIPMFYRCEFPYGKLMNKKGEPVNYADGIYDSLTIVGYGYLTEEEEHARQFNGQFYEGIVCCSDSTLEHMQSLITAGKTDLELRINKSTMQVYPTAPHPIVASHLVEEGKAYIPESLAQEFPYGNTSGKTLDLTLNRNGQRSLTLSIASVYNKNNVNSLLGKSIDDINSEAIYMNGEDIRRLYEDGSNFQVTVNIKENKYAKETISTLEKQGYKVLYLNDTSSEAGNPITIVLSGIRKVLLAIFLAVLFFISYFIIKLIFKSRNVYFSTVRMLGGSSFACSGMILTEMLLVFHIAFAAVAGLIIKVKDGTINSFEFLNRNFLYIEPRDILILYVIILVMTLFLALRYSSQMFSKTAMNAYKEEV